MAFHGFGFVFGLFGVFGAQSWSQPESITYLMIQLVYLLVDTFMRLCLAFVYRAEYGAGLGLSIVVWCSLRYFVAYSVYALIARLQVLHIGAEYQAAAAEYVDPEGGTEMT